MKKIKSKKKVVANINSLADLEVILYFLGGKSMGESIVIVFQDKEKEQNLFVFVIDSLNGLSEFLTKLKGKYNFDFLTDVIWTHPHDDHTKGLLQVLKSHLFKPNERLVKSHNGTRFVIPDFLYINRDKLKVMKVDRADVAELLKFKAVGIYLGKYRKNNHIRRPLQINGVLINDFVTFEFITPRDNLLDIADFRRTTEGKINEMSLSFVLNIANKYYMYFGGDTEDGHIKLIDKKQEELLNKCKIAKIPHHGSRESKEIIKYLGGLDYAIVTSFVRKNGKSGVCLPKYDVLELYNEILPQDRSVLNPSDLLSGDADCEIGIIKITLDAFDTEVVNSNQEKYIYNYKTNDLSKL